MSNTLILAAIGALIAGVVMFLRSSKEREANGEWSGGLQWAIF